MIFNVEVGELHVRTADGRVYLVVHDENRQSVMFSLSPLAAHNLGIVLPDYAREAAIANLASSTRDDPADMTDMTDMPDAQADDAALARIEGSIYP